jgi:hypothetical protein
MDYFAGLDMSMDETRVSFSAPGRRNLREQKSRRQRRSREVVESAEMRRIAFPLRQAVYVGLREDRAATDVRRKPRAADSAQIEGPGISPLGGKHAYNGRLEKDRSPHDSRHPIASAEYASPPRTDSRRCLRITFCFGRK